MSERPECGWRDCTREVKRILSFTGPAEKVGYCREHADAAREYNTPVGARPYHPSRDGDLST